MKKPAIIEVDFKLYYPKPFVLYQYLECVHYGEKEMDTPKQDFEIFMDPQENLFEFKLKSGHEFQALYS